jgi:hypothetical protein
VRYIPDLLSLSEAREFIMPSGLSLSEAGDDITRAMREGKIRSKRAIERVTFRGQAVQPEVFRRTTVKDGNTFRLLVPADLASEDLDWENSRPRKPWPLGEGYFAHIARLELWRRDLERVFRVNEAPKEKHGTASQPSASEPAERRNLDDADEVEQQIDQRNDADDGDDGADDVGQERRQRQHLRDIVDEPQHDADDEDVHEERDQLDEIVESRGEARSRASRTAAKASVASRREKAEKWREWVTAHAPAMRLKHPTATQEDLADKLIAQATKEGIELPQRKTLVTHLSALERACKLPKRTTSSRTPRS